MYGIGEREMVFCPYNRYHIVSKLRIQKHLVKCQKNYPDVKLATCFYNYSHRLKPEDMLKHYEICSHKTRLKGSHFYEANNLQSSNLLENNDPFTEKFPQIHAKPKFFTNPATLSSTSQPNSNVGEKLNSSSSGSESDYQLEVGKGATKTEFSGNDSEDDLEPLPLPKTVSKAFMRVHQSTDKFSYEASPCKRFGRGKNFLSFSPSKPSSTSDNFLSDLSTAEGDRENKSEETKGPIGSTASISPSVFEFDYIIKSSRKSLLKSSSASITSSIPDNSSAVKSKSLLPSNSSMSITSSMFDDGTTLKSEEIIFDEDSSDEDKRGDRQNKSKESKGRIGSTASISPSVFEFDYIIKSNPKSLLKNSGASITSSIPDNSSAVKSKSLLPSNSSMSITSSMFDDSTTLKSEEVIFDEDCSDDDKSYESFAKKLQL